MSLGELTDATVRYLYARTWLPASDGDYGVAVPGGSVRAVDAAGNLLHIAMWSLRSQGLMEFEQLRPVEDEKVRVLGLVVFTDIAAVESLRQRHDKLRAARGDYLDAEPDLTNAVMSDCLRTVADAYSPDLGD